MPKTKEDLGTFFRRILKEFPNIFRTNGKILFCKICDNEISAKQIFQVKQHLQTAKHVSNLKRKENGNFLSQELISNCGEADRSANVFSMDLARAFLQANIPLHKIRNESVVTFIEKYTKFAAPSEYCLRSKCLPSLYNEVKEKMKKIAENNYIFVTIDETTDVDQRMIANFVFGILGVEEKRGETYLFASSELEATNSTTIGTFFDKSIQELGKIPFCSTIWFIF